MNVETLRHLASDYGELANRRIRETLGFTDSDFASLRRPYDDPRRTESKRAMLEIIRQACKQDGTPLYG
jgi:hypothetical protein